jgi:hypothetical protein
MTSRLPAFGIAALILGDLVLASSAPSSRPAAPGGALAATGSMHVPRAVHTATLLRDGRVLVAGGMQKNGVFENTAELYDPASGRFETLPKLATRRVGHSATLLPSGKVLIAGGTGGRRFEGGRWIGDVAASAELYDPASRTFRPTGSMRTPRAHQAAVLLADDRVLVAGGYAGADSNALSSAEIYDPASGVFLPAGSLATARVADVAVLLQDGRVLVPGGTDGAGNVLATCEIFDPRKNAFGPAGPMIAARRKHGAVLLASGRVLVVGGSDAHDWNGQKTEAETYDPRSNLFSPAASMGLRRFKMALTVALLRDGRVLVAGGAAAPEIYDPAKGEFQPVSGGYGQPRYYATATLLADGRVLVAGGYGTGTASEGPLSTTDAWLFTP